MCLDLLIGISLLQLVLQATPNDSIAPFFPILSAHLSCAMTHIQEDIQMDSLAVLDLILQFYPRLLTAQSRQLLTIFVQQISQQKKKTFGWAENDGETENKLTIKPGSKISSHYWRQKVRLLKAESHCSNNENDNDQYAKRLYSNG